MKFVDKIGQFDRRIANGTKKRKSGTGANVADVFEEHEPAEIDDSELLSEAMFDSSGNTIDRRPWSEKYAILKKYVTTNKILRTINT